MSDDPKTARDVLILKYGELAMRKARTEAKPEEVSEMTQILTDLDITEAELLAELEHIVKRGY